jgi:hypothetical protein
MAFRVFGLGWDWGYLVMAGISGRRMDWHTCELVCLVSGKTSYDSKGFRFLRS